MLPESSRSAPESTHHRCLLREKEKKTDAYGLGAVHALPIWAGLSLHVENYSFSGLIFVVCACRVPRLLMRYTYRANNISTCRSLCMCKPIYIFRSMPKEGTNNDQTIIIKQKFSTPTGLEPAQNYSNRFLVDRLNHSATVSEVVRFTYYNDTRGQNI